MKTDRELLELAAKAAGITGWQSKHGYWNMKGFNGEDVVCCNNWPNFDPNTGRKLAPTFADAVLELNWAPLADDGDALRLAALKKMCIDFRNKRVTAGDGFQELLCDFLDGDYKRAIVLVAATIGEAM